MTYNDYLTAPVILLLAVVLDYFLGDPKKWHPLAGFGRLAAWLELHMRKTDFAGEPAAVMRAKGAAAVTFLIVPCILLSAALAAIPLWGSAFQIMLVYFALGATSLARHARTVSDALKANDLDQARFNVGMIVSRDTVDMQAADVSKAAIESVLENGSDAIFAAIFWFLLLGAPGIVMYRLANTLDAMWGYRSTRYLHFGWAAARFDDLLNWLPARLTALTYTLLGNRRLAWRCWHSQAKHWYSPNAGPVMAAGAGALNLELGGPAIYGGVSKYRPILGAGPQPQPADIARAIALVRRGLALWVVLALAGGMIMQSVFRMNFHA